MNHRQRVHRTLNHQEPDRVPIDLWGSDSRITNTLYFKIKEHLGLEGLGEKNRPGRTAEYVDYRISDSIDADFRHVVIRKPNNFQSYVDENGYIIDEWGIGYKIIGGYPQISYHPLADAELSDIDSHRWPVAEDEGRIEGLAQEVRDWYENTDYSITSTTPISGIVLEFYQYLRGMENFFIDLYYNIKFAEKLIHVITEKIIEFYVYFINPIGKYLDWVEFASDLGTQASTFMSREMFNKFLKKPMAKIFKEVRQASKGSKIFLHSCGSIRDLIPEFIDIGVDILSALQPLANKMDPFELKKEFGKDIVFHGGADIQRGLTGTVQMAEEEARTKIQAFAPGGGYIAGPSNHFQTDTSVEAFMAYYKATLKYGKYPIKTE